ncbi:ComF family protein [Actinomyces sp. MRS3W]|uniref:ComF family protein n=1 Tax=Actinomyces sp. MRS3W TaxID=2800796 RepID=UPI0028FD4749|nr:phosphoribosyltransferase family protein [Actinomyces sp. MRS3W]MDU0347673.1 phosphoribosyltransferase family protein [Actinomyces sp. MRS3W]
MPATDRSATPAPGPHAVPAVRPGALAGHPLAALRRALREAARLGLPLACAGCGRWDVALCEDCAALLDVAPHQVEHADAAGDLPLWTIAAYTGPVRALVLGWKNGSREDLGPVMSRVGERAGQWLAGNLHTDAVAAVEAAGQLLVVPAPSGLRRRLRGRLVAADFADAVAHGLATGWAADGSKQPVTVLSADVVRRRIGTGGAHQAGRSATQRRANRSVPPRLLTPVRGMPVVLVDDVVTTGATLGACARALTQGGAVVLGALTVAAAPPPSRHRPVRVPGGPVRTPTPSATDARRTDAGTAGMRTAEIV